MELSSLFAKVFFMLFCIVNFLLIHSILVSLWEGFSALTTHAHVNTPQMQSTLFFWIFLLLFRFNFFCRFFIWNFDKYTHTRTHNWTQFIKLGWRFHLLLLLLLLLLVSREFTCFFPLFSFFPLLYTVARPFFSFYLSFFLNFFHTEFSLLSVLNWIFHSITFLGFKLLGWICYVCVLNFLKIYIN